MSRFNCPNCGSGETQRRSLIASSGTTNNVNFTSGSFGTYHGRRSFDAVNFGTSSTRLADESSAPGKKVVFLLSIPGFFLSGLAGLQFDAVGVYVVLGVFAYWGYANFLWNKNEWPVKYENWKNSFLCYRCGEVFVSGRIQSIKSSSLVDSKKQKENALKFIVTLIFIALIYYYGDKALRGISDQNSWSEYYNSEESAISAADSSVAETMVPRDSAELERLSSGVGEPEQIAESVAPSSADLPQDTLPEPRSSNDNFETPRDRTAMSGARGYLQLRFEPGPRGTGVYVEDVIPGGAAERAGLRSGDIIYSINGEHVAGGEGLVAAVSRYGPGDIVEIEAMPADWSIKRIYKLRLATSPTP